MLGADHVWLTFSDEQYEAEHDAETVYAGLEPWIAMAGAVLIPGYPLKNPDHAWLHELLVTRVPAIKLGLYVEQPYATDVLTEGSLRSLRPYLNTARLAARTGVGSRPAARLPRTLGAGDGSGLAWRARRSDRRSRAVKAQAIRAYRSQYGTLGPRLAPRIAVYEAIAGGEWIAARPVAWAAWTEAVR